MIDLLTVLGVALVLPLAVGGPARGWAAAAMAAAVALVLPAGPVAALLVTPWLAVAAGRLRTTRPADLPSAAIALAALYAVVAAAAFGASRAGLALFGIGEPIVQLTAVHYTYAGSAALVLAAQALVTAPPSLGNLATAGVVLTAAAPPVVAVGFVTGWALFQVGGAVLMTLGVFATAALHLHAVAADRTGRPHVRFLLAVSGLAVWLPMVLAVAWAVGQHVDIPALSIDDMARTHGVANAVGFTLAGLVARRMQQAHDPSVHTWA